MVVWAGLSNSQSIGNSYTTISKRLKITTLKEYNVLVSVTYHLCYLTRWAVKQLFNEKVKQHSSSIRVKGRGLLGMSKLATVFELWPKPSRRHRHKKPTDFFSAYYRESGAGAKLKELKRSGTGQMLKHLVRTGSRGRGIVTVLWASPIKNIGFLSPSYVHSRSNRRLNKCKCTLMR